MIVQKRTQVGPGISLNFQGGDKSVVLNSLSVFGKSVQSAVPTPEAPSPIISIADSGTLNITINGIVYSLSVGPLRGLKYVEKQYGYLVGNGAYLTTKDGDRLMAK